MIRDIHDGRFLALAGADNVRDLGGLPTDRGWWTRPRRLLRGELTPELTAGDVDLLSQEIGLRTVIDLRRDDEVRAAPLSWPRESVRRLHCPLALPSSQALPRTAGELVTGYLDFLSVDPAPLVAAMRAVLDPACHPVLFHCASGKDRTGVLSALALDVLGVPREVNARDYALTSARMPRVTARLAGIDLYRRQLKSVTPEALDARAPTLLAFLGRVDALYGGPLAWLLGHGIESAEVERFRATMLRATSPW
jgi:protein-tyrosine phosphatase